MPPSQQEAFIAAFNDAFYNTYVPEVEEIRILTDTIILPASEQTTFTVISPGTPEYQEFYDLIYPVTEAYLAELDARGFDGKAEFETIKKYLDKWETNWFTFDRYMEPFIAASEGTFQASDYTLPEGMPAPGKA